MDFDHFLVTIFVIFSIFFENVEKCEITLWLQPGLDFKGLALPKSHILASNVHSNFMFFLERLLDFIFSHIFRSCCLTYLLKFWYHVGKAEILICPVPAGGK